MVKQIKCISCRYARPDYAQRETLPVMGINGTKKKMWIGVECGNPQSSYCKSLLNITPSGNILWRVTWGGCEHGEGKVKLL